MFSNINLVADNKIIDHLDEADEIMGNIDKDDVSFIALALAFDNDGIWTDDAHFEKQDKIKILKTRDILELFKREFSED